MNGTVEYKVDRLNSRDQCVSPRGLAWIDKQKHTLQNQLI